jgi:RNA polymerase sigma-B factor
MESMNGPDSGRRADADLLRLVQSRPADDPERRAACETLVGRYENIVRSCVYRYRTGPELSEDLMQVGYVGLMKAINNFDPEVGDSLAAYAQPCVSGEIKRHFRDKRWQIRVRRSTQELRLRIGSVTADLTQQLSRPPGDAELAAHLGVTEAEIADAQLASHAFQATSLDGPAGADDDSACLGDLLSAEDPALEQELDISQMHVSRLLSHALGYLRDRITGTAEPAGE